MASSNFKNLVRIPNLGQNFYFSTILQLMKCCPHVQDLLFRHFEQCLDCADTDFAEEAEKGQEHKYLVF